MSDTTVAPPSAAPQAAPAPAPAANEVPINTNQPNTPNPVGPQAPSRTESAREAIQKAFDRANNPRAKDAKPTREAPKPAEARSGHNNPPEDTPKLNLKKRPDDQEPAQAPGSGGTPNRGERGRFAPRQNNAQNNANTTQNNANAQQPYKKLPPHAPYADPPVRVSEKARRDWHATPESVRADVHRWQNEFGKAYSYYKASHEAYKPIKHYDDMAKQHGTTLGKALDNYVSMETKLRSDPLGGLDLIVHNLGLTDPETGRQITLRDIAYTVLSQSPEQLRMMQQGNQQNAAQHQIGALHQEISTLKQTLNQMHTQQQFTYTRSAVDQFAASHPRFDELGTLIEQELKLGFPLEVAYRRAELLRPAAHAPQKGNTPAQTRPTDRSISGSPDVAPSNGASRRQKDPSPTARDAVKNAMQRYGGTH